jgi:GNAT superfamily N-acetyltransferase
MTHSPTSVTIPVETDGEAIMKIARSIRIFESYDVECIQELWNQYAIEGEACGYFFRVARREGEVVGFACYGIRALADGAYDLYWIAVHQDHHRQRIGEALIKRVDEEIVERSGRLLIIETGGKPSFEPTRKFYLRSGCELEARIRDFYAPGDDLIIFTKHF